MYQLLKPLLFQLDAERAHTLGLKGMKAANSLGLMPLLRGVADFRQPTTIKGLTFPNPIGLAAGLDKNGDYLEPLSKLGFGFIEVGTVTPRPQPGNPKPRLFRVKNKQAVINRMGFNNEGVDHLIERLKGLQRTCPIGINIGKNFDTPNEKAMDDYIICLKKAFPSADYIVVNISSPNTKGLRDLQHKNELSRLLEGLKNAHEDLKNSHKKDVPLMVKIAPDLTDIQIDEMAEVLLAHNIDGCIATNTTLSRQGVENEPFGEEAGGMSGAPLLEKSTVVLQKMQRLLDGKIPLIGVGGITCGEDARAKFKAGATLIQVYSGFIYRGPALIKEIVRSLQAGKSTV